MSRGVLYIVWGDKPKHALQRSIASLRGFHPDLPVEVVRLPDTTDRFKGLLEKAGMLRRSPFEQTLFLDADTVVLDRLDFGFRQAERHGLACAICECPWSGRYRGLRGQELVEYNTGVVFFTKRSQTVFDRWEALVTEVDSSIEVRTPDGRVGEMPYNDQAAFSVAVAEWDRPPFVLPLNWNFRPHFQSAFFGPIKIWHDYSDPPAELAALNAHYRQPGAYIDFHSLVSQRASQ
jgi:hypothetical protein